MSRILTSVILFIPQNHSKMPLCVSPPLKELSITLVHSLTSVKQKVSRMPKSKNKQKRIYQNVHTQVIHRNLAKKNQTQSAPVCLIPNSFFKSLRFSILQSYSLLPSLFWYSYQLIFGLENYNKWPFTRALSITVSCYKQKCPWHNSCYVRGFLVRH